MMFSNDASGFVSLSHFLPSILCEIRYHSSYNFIGDRIDGYEEPLALATREAAEALKKAAALAAAKGYIFKIYDAYRPQSAVDHFVRWAEDTTDTRMKSVFYPNVNKKDLFSQGFIARHSGHSRGSTIDLTLFDITAGKEVDMGGPFDFFGPLSHPDHTEGLTAEQFSNRQLLRGFMLDSGFRPLSTEWWHFTLDNEPYPDTYFTFPVRMDSLR